MSHYESEMARMTLAFVCSHEPEIRERLARLDKVPLLDELLNALRGDQDATDLLDQIHAALRRGGDALGLYGHSQVGTRSLHASGFGPYQRVDVVFPCPGGRCYGWQPNTVCPPPPGEHPTCAVDGQRIDWQRFQA